MRGALDYVFNCILISLLMTIGGGAMAASNNDSRPSSPAAALQALMDGNDRWCANRPLHPNADLKRRDQLAREGQKPFAAILSCADSRVPPELLFDAGVGDLFVVRVAGNSIAKLEEQSLEYAAEHLHVETIAVIGHQKCGAVAGAVDSYPKPAPEFLSAIYPAIEKSQDILKKRIDNPQDKDAIGKEAINQHVLMVVNELRNTAPFKDLIAAGKLSIVGGRYDLDTGRVVMLVQ